jgi:transcriptional regulator with PAS, ATPase and Fis domain
MGKLTDHEVFELIVNSFLHVGPIIATDSEDAVMFISDDYIKMLKFKKKEDVLGKHILTVVPNSNIPAVRRSGQPDWKLFTLANGEKVIANYIPLTRNNKVVGIFSYTSLHKSDISTHSTIDYINRLNDDMNQYRSELQKLRGAKYSLDSIVGTSDTIRDLKELIKRVAKTKSTVLITGDTGTGKELFAHSVHQSSPRNHHSFVALNCAAIPKDLIESELFGYEEGAFSGARRGGKPGKFEMAHKGTLYLDEIDQLPYIMQSKILRAIQEKEIERIGGTKIIHTDIRLICTSNRNLQELVDKGDFRGDLYYRINVVSLHVPPLRERLDDIPALVKHFVAKINKELGLNIHGVNRDILKSFQDYHWPGNVRELEHLLERAANLALSGNLNAYHFNNFMPRLLESNREKFTKTIMHLNVMKTKMEKEAIVNVLHMTNGNKKRASEILNLDRSLLYKKIRKYKIGDKIIAGP